MKFFHLSDLHIGKIVNGLSMIPDQRYIFAQIITYIREERPTAVIIAGDVYDRAVPGVDAVAVFDDFLTELAQEEVTVLLVAGNHDSPERISYASRLLADKNIFFSGVYGSQMQKISLPDEFGEVNFWLLPFLKPALLSDSYDTAVQSAIADANIDYDARNVLISHQFYTKSGVIPMLSESERSPIGGLDAVDATLVEKFDYVALGHLHRAQKVGAEHIRYCGSPIKYSFSELGQDKAITVVEMSEKGRVEISVLPLKPMREMREITGLLDKLISPEVYNLGEREDYLRVVLTDEHEIIDPMGKLRAVYPNVLSLIHNNSNIEYDNLTEISNIESVNMYELFSEFFFNLQGAQMIETQAEIVRNLLGEGNE